MKFKSVVSLAFALFAMGAQATVIGDTSLQSPVIGHSGEETFAVQAQKSRVDSPVQADDSLPLPESDLVLLAAGVAVVGFLSARRRGR